MFSRLRRNLRARSMIAAALFALLGTALLVPNGPTHAAGDGLDIASWLRRPGVKLVVVEFYADWCAPCKASVPKWRALHDKYRKSGLRLLVVAVGENGDCANPGWDPDQVICDLDGSIQEKLQAKALPQAFLWSWQGNLLAKNAPYEAVERSVEKYFADAPRILVEQGTTNSPHPAAKASAEELSDLVQAELGKLGKLDVVASQANRERLAALKKQVVTDERYSDKSRCELGQEVSPNSTLKPRIVSPDGKTQSVVLEVYSIERGCMIESETTRVIAGDLNAAVVEGVHAIIERLTGGSLRSLAEAPRSPSAPLPNFAPRDIGGAAAAWTPNVAQTFIVGFQSNPAGAVVLLDEKLLCQATPCSREVEVGRHTVSMQAEQYLERREAVNVTDAAPVTWKLEPNFATISVTTTPAGLDIDVNGKVVGKSPVTSLRLSPGKHTVKTVSPCHETVGKEFAVKRGDSVPLSFAPPFTPAGIKVSVTDSRGDAVAADVLVDGINIGKSPGTFTVPVCSKKLVAKHQKHASENLLTLQAKQVRAVELRISDHRALNSSDDRQMVFVPGGEFFVGSNADVGSVATLGKAGIEWVTVTGGIKMARTETTVAQFKACVDDRTCDAPTKCDYDGEPNWGKSDRSNHPVQCVSWSDATTFCEWAGGRLPTVQEWAAEAFARGEYPWGDTEATCSYAVIDFGGGGCGRSSTWPVCSKTKGNSVSGLCDMAGNVWEWTSSREGSLPVLRGGSWVNEPQFARASFHFRDSLSRRFEYYGFRCAQSAP